MISCSHWGMFKYSPPIFIVPAGWEIDAADLGRLHLPGGIIRMKRVGG